MALDINQLRDLLAAIAETDITELTLKSDDFELTVRKGVSITPTSDSGGASTPYQAAGSVGVPISGSTIPTAPTPVLEVASTPAATVPSVPPPGVDQKWEEINSPMVGTFYRAPAPDEDPFVEVGERISAGQTVCIIEAMKLMNEIEAEVSGQVMEILVKNGEPIEYGQALMRIKPD
ncbi:acetyl-CoA carboxylase biotin carboxyl carrier protein [Moorena producens JHB]|uniref:Biotin carboxyl carrier protein of acetyl-CoA carboxylase n=1 Tax=Moorena producens (strain JHB) TaxID=1454205 RepID=A0A1D9G3B5_MOOP1|nr:acetyl-CoA carboxylase biotin carboxyl carrier protein [Moorena producens]AOY82127.1 acetyl-CoA carboxylase biotin carboxyl carrier protein [Moorena producens JHB]